MSSPILSFKLQQRGLSFVLHRCKDDDFLTESNIGAAGRWDEQRNIHQTPQGPRAVLQWRCPPNNDLRKRAVGNTTSWGDILGHVNGHAFRQREYAR